MSDWIRKTIKASVICLIVNRCTVKRKQNRKLFKKR